MLPVMEPLPVKAKLSVSALPVRFSKEEKVVPLTEPALVPLMIQLASGPTMLSLADAEPMTLLMLEKVPPTPGEVSFWRLRVTGPVNAERLMVLAPAAPPLRFPE